MPRGFAIIIVCLLCAAILVVPSARDEPAVSAQRTFHMNPVAITDFPDPTVIPGC